jgi:hypothetical protein
MQERRRWIEKNRTWGGRGISLGIPCYVLQMKKAHAVKTQRYSTFSFFSLKKKGTVGKIVSCRRGWGQEAVICIGNRQFFFEAVREVGGMMKG